MPKKVKAEECKTILIKKGRYFERKNKKLSMYNNRKSDSYSKINRQFIDARSIQSMTFLLTN